MAYGVITHSCSTEPARGNSVQFRPGQGTVAERHSQPASKVVAGLIRRCSCPLTMIKLPYILLFGCSSRVSYLPVCGRRRRLLWEEGPGELFRNYPKHSSTQPSTRPVSSLLYYAFFPLYIFIVKSTLSFLAPKDLRFADEPAPMYESIDPENDSIVDPLYSKVSFCLCLIFPPACFPYSQLAGA